MSWTNISQPGILPLVLWYVNRAYKDDAARIPIHGSVSFKYVSCRFYVRTRFPSTLFILSMIAFSCGFLGEYCLVLIKYSFSINIFKNLWPRNSPPWLYVISTGHVYRTSHVVYTKFANHHQFLVSILCYFKPTGYGVYHCNGF